MPSGDLNVPNPFHTLFVSCTSFRWDNAQQWHVHLQNRINSNMKSIQILISATSHAASNVLHYIWSYVTVKLQKKAIKQFHLTCYMQLVVWEIQCVKSLYKWYWTNRQLSTSCPHGIFYTHNTKQKLISLILSEGSFPNF